MTSFRQRTIRVGKEEDDMRVILVDDEPLILDRFAKLITGNEGIQLVGKFSDPRQAFEAIVQKQPDVVFLDVEMPELNGIEMAEKIQAVLPRTKVVFVTAYREYAVEAFELNAVDYLVKPVQRERLNETIRRLKKEMVVKQTFHSLNQDVMVCCFQSLRFKQTHKPSRFLDVHWRTAKAKELFSFLIHHRHTPVHKEAIIDQLWPDTDYEKSVAQLYSTVYQIRQALKKAGIHITIASFNHSYKLDLNGIRLDVDEWERRINEQPIMTEATLDHHREILDLYGGDYLAESGYLWAESERERLRALWLHHIRKVTDFLLAKKDYIGAIALCHRIQDYYPFMEDSYFELMQLYNKLGDRKAVIQQYMNLKQMLKEEYEMDPPATIKTWYHIWKEDNDPL
ncbi:response regulator [Anoxybacillus rupiensis]|uniref:response regulator n=1 Tax=Anoxybacteroides rupiense TaxID=311460 RepID=UPI001BACAB9D|nr:response regulator [Anoxybacillus rupiensis]MBS2772054.1 response regulator [Anoxybacillus rupiensis]